MRKVEAGEQKQNPKMQFLPKSFNQQMGSLIERIFEPRKNHPELEIRHLLLHKFLTKSKVSFRVLIQHKVLNQVVEGLGTI